MVLRDRHELPVRFSAALGEIDGCQMSVSSDCPGHRCYRNDERATRQGTMYYVLWKYALGNMLRSVGPR